MPQNVFSAGADALLDMLAKRDAERRLEEDRQRRAQLDAAEMAAEQRRFGLQERQLGSLDADRRERREEAKRLAQEKAAEKATHDKALKDASLAYKNATTPEEREAARVELAALGRNFPEPRAPRPPLMTSPGQIGRDPDDPTKILFQNPDRPRQGPPPDARLRDDPTLPQGTKAWIESIAGRGGSVLDARKELSAGWATQKSTHPRADLAKAAKYLADLYPDDRPMAPAPAPSPVPVPAPTGTGRSTGAGPVGAGPKPEVDPLDAAAEKFLQDNGAPVTPANIAAVKARMGGGQ